MRWQNKSSYTHGCRALTWLTRLSCSKFVLFSEEVEFAIFTLMAKFQNCSTLSSNGTFMDHSHLRDSVAGNVFLLWFFYFFIISSLISAVCQLISLKFARICVIYERRSQMQANPKQILKISEVLYKWGKFWIFSCDFSSFPPVKSRPSVSRFDLNFAC